MNAQLAVVPQHTAYTDDQVALIKRTIAVGATNDELSLFVAQCRLTTKLSGNRRLSARTRVVRLEETKMTNYILNGHEAEACDDLRKWAEWFCAADRTVAKTKVGDAEVSTVFLGIDHAFGGQKPLLFETMVFRAGHGDEQERYSTWDEAEAGHRAMCERLTPAGSNTRNQRRA